ncbi:hypothetical protein QW131_03730 [Roseibium salinum]|nr:hypothetical protein [Roseibium salinum]
MGYSCIAELRMIETINSGEAKTPFLKFGDSVRIEMLDGEGHSIFRSDRADGGKGLKPLFSISVPAPNADPQSSRNEGERP